MSSPLKPVNPIRLKWATFSQHTRELERRHMWFFFFPPFLSAPPPFTTAIQWCSSPGNPRITPFQRAEDAGHSLLNYWSLSSFQEGQSHCWTAQYINVSVQQPWELPDMSRVCSSLMQKWQFSLIYLVFNTQALSWSVWVICAPTGGKDSPVFEAQTLIRLLLEGSVGTPKGPKIFKKLEKTFQSARTNLRR